MPLLQANSLGFTYPARNTPKDVIPGSLKKLTRLSSSAESPAGDSAWKDRDWRRSEDVCPDRYGRASLNDKKDVSHGRNVKLKYLLTLQKQTPLVV